MHRFYELDGLGSTERLNEPEVCVARKYMYAIGCSEILVNQGVQLQPWNILEIWRETLAPEERQMLLVNFMEMIARERPFAVKEVCRDFLIEASEMPDGEVYEREILKTKAMAELAEYAKGMFKGATGATNAFGKA